VATAANPPVSNPFATGEDRPMEQWQAAAGGERRRQRNKAGGGELNEAGFRREMRRQLGFTCVEAEGDGNCLFRSVSHQVYGDQENHAVVRAKCLEYMECQAYFFEAFVSDEPLQESVPCLLLPCLSHLLSIPLLFAKFILCQIPVYKNSSTTPSGTLPG
jgi:hypothetical protein